MREKRSPPETRAGSLSAVKPVQLRGQGCTIPGDFKPFDTPAPSRHEGNGARRDAQRRGEKSDQCGIGLAFTGGGTHPRLEHRGAVGELGDAVDGIAPPLWRHPNREREAAWR